MAEPHGSAIISYPDFQLFLEGSRLNVNFIILNRSGDFAFHSGQILYSGNLMVRAKVDDYGMRERRAGFSAPIGGFLKVENLVSRTIDMRHVLTVG